MKTISVDTLKAKISKGESLHLLDVREQDEHQDFNVGGILIPLGQILTMQIDDIDHLKNESVICYCRSGKRSMQACMMLETMGFTDVSNLEGGMLAWQS